MLNPSPLIFELSRKGRQNLAQQVHVKATHAIPESLLRKTPPALPECSELEVVRHYTRLSQRNFAIDTHFYPLGSCTMKYNPRGVHRAAMQNGFLNQHPLASQSTNQGTLEALYHLQQLLSEITGMKAVCLTPMAGAQGEFAGVAMIKAYHTSRGDTKRTEMLIPDAAHGTNPATAAMCGYTVIELKTKKNGDLDLVELKQKVSEKTAGIMLTNPSTLGLFMTQIQEIAAIIHAAGGLMYYDGANLNAILGKVKPSDMGFDVVHLNLHKTFATPHGGGGPGAGPIGVSARLTPFIPQPIVMKEANHYRLSTQQDFPQSIGRLSCFMGNTLILLRAYFYILMLGRVGLQRVSDYATLNANYLMKQLEKAGFTLAFPQARATHEFIVTLAKEKKDYGVTAQDVGKRLLDYGMHAPTTYFPLLIPECLLIEPTETESPETLDAFVAAMRAIRKEMTNNPELLKEAPHTMPVKRLDDTKAARELDIRHCEAAPPSLRGA